LPLWFDWYEELEQAHNRRDGLLESLEEVRRDPSKRRYIAELESQLRPLEREIDVLEAKEQEYEERRREEREAREEYYRRLRQ
jgi:TolA-binding protein